MRKNNKILKITNIQFPEISFISNNGEFRKIDIKQLFRKLNFKLGDFGYEVIESETTFKKAEIIDNAIGWKEVSQTLNFDNNSLELFFHLDPIVTIENSIIDIDRTKIINYGKSIKEFRKYVLKLSQEELGEKIGSDKQYISKVENYKTDIELKTLRKIYEVGLDRNMFIAHYHKDDLLNTFANSILKYKFIVWAEKNKSNIDLIEGIENEIKRKLSFNNINSTDDLSKIEIEKLFDILKDDNGISFYHQANTWPIQAKLLNESDWFTLIKLQRSISKKGNSSYSKFEEIAKKELNEGLYQVE